jgi:general secretion pathway protein C
MTFDALLKRFFPAIVLFLIAVAAYFQAAGITELVAGAFLDTPPAKTPPKSAARPLAASSDTRGAKTAEPILSRNPFDSVTGPLNRSPVEATEGAAESSQQVDLSNPLNSPDCGGISAHVITESTDPTWSIAVLQAPGDQLGRMRRVGDNVGDKQVAYIGFNPAKNSPSVWLVGGSALCQVLLFAPATPPAPPPQADAPKAQAATTQGGVPKDISDRIQKVSDTEFHVDRAVVDNILEHQADLMKQARIVPEQKDGKVVGIRLFGIRPDTLLGKLGLQNGDRLEAINGFEMASPEKALEAYAKLRTAESLNVKVTRRGQPVSIDFKIQ